MRYTKFLITTLVMLLLATATFAQTSSGGGFDLRGHVNGGSTSSGGDYTVTGAIGQPASEVSTGGDFRVTSGFLSVIKSLFSPYDMDYNNLVTPEDVVYVINRVGVTVTAAVQLADVNDDGVINNNDVNAVISQLGQVVP